VRLEGLGQLKKKTDLISNLSRVLPACSIVPNVVLINSYRAVFRYCPSPRDNQDTTVDAYKDVQNKNT
jgi:hypothetical protein